MCNVKRVGTSVKNLINRGAISWVKYRMRVIHYKLLAIQDQYSCGVDLLRMLRPDVCELERKFNELNERLKKLDQTHPSHQPVGK